MGRLLQIFDPENQELGKKQDKKNKQSLLYNRIMSQPAVLLDADINAQGITQCILPEQAAGQNIGQKAYKPSANNAGPIRGCQRPIEQSH